MRRTTANIGKRLNVVMKSGDRFVDRLSDLTDRSFTFEIRGKVLKANVRSASIARATVIRAKQGSVK